MSEKEKQAAEKRKKELEMLLVKKEADALFARNEEEKRVRKKIEMKSLQDFHSGQMVSYHDLFILINCWCYSTMGSRINSP